MHTESEVKSNVSDTEQSCFLPTIYASTSEESQFVENDIASAVDCPEVDELVEKSEFFQSALKLASSLYDDVQLSRKQANCIIAQIDDLLNGDFVNSLKKLILNSNDLL